MQVKSGVQRLGKVAQCHAVADGIINASDAQTYGNDDEGRGVFESKEDFERAMPALANAGYYAVLERKDGEVVLYAPYTELKDALGGGRQQNPNAGKNLFSVAKQDPAGAGNNDAAFAEMEAVRRAFTRPDGTKRRGWLRAPNGRRSNLDERKWLLARTRTFKEAAGDWELARLLELARRAWEDNTAKEKFSFKPSERLATTLADLVGHDVDEITITSDSVRHIRNQHGVPKEERRGQVPLTYQDIVLLPYILNNFDYAVPSESHDKGGKVAVEIRKRINGTSIVATVETGPFSQIIVSHWVRKNVAPTEPMLSANEGRAPEPNVQDGADAHIQRVQQEIAEVKRLANNVSVRVDENGEPLASEVRRVMGGAANGNGVRFSFAKGDPVASARPGGSVRETMDRSRQWLETKFIHDQTPVFDAVRRVSGNDPLPDRLNVEAAAKNVHGKIRARQEEVNKVYVDALVGILREPGMSKEVFDDYAMALHAIDRNRMIQARSVVRGAAGLQGGGEMG